MNLHDLLTHSGIHLKKEELGRLIGPDPEAFDQLFGLACSRELPVCWRAAWIMDHLAELHPELAKKYISKVWSEIPAKHADGVTRSWLRTLTRYAIPEEHEGVAADLCMQWLEKEQVPVGIKAYCMEILLLLARRYPDLKNEFIAVMETQSPNNSAGFKARARQIISAMQKI